VSTAQLLGFFSSFMLEGLSVRFLLLPRFMQARFYHKSSEVYGTKGNCRITRILLRDSIL
jgi:hypothetical protein